MKLTQDDASVCDRCVVHPWLDDLTMKQQTVLLSALRGCDGVAKDDISKKFVRVYRSLILQNAAPGQGRFMSDLISDWDINTFLKAPDVYPMHWLMHFIHAIEIVGYNYPIKETQIWWYDLYRRLVYALHFNIETSRQNDERLKDGFSRDCWKT